MQTITLSLDETSFNVHRKVGNKSALYRWALWQFHLGNQKAVEAAGIAPQRPQGAAERPKPARRTGAKNGRKAR